MPRAARGANVRYMIRLVIVIAVLAAGVVVVKQRSDAVGVAAPAAPPVSSSKVPEEFRRLLADAPDPASILREQGALPGLGAIRRLAGGDSTAERRAAVAAVRRRRLAARAAARSAATSAATSRRSTGSARKGGVSLAAAERTLAEVYSAPVLERLGAEGRRDFAAAARRPHPRRPADQGRRLRGRLRLRLARAGPGRLPALDPLALGPLRRPLPADLDRPARPRGRPLALRAGLRDG